VRALGSRSIFLDCAIYPPTIYGYLRTGFRLVRTPRVGERTKARFLAARTYTVDEALQLAGYAVSDLDGMDADDRRMLLSALLVKIYFKSNGLSEAQALAKAKQWPAESDSRRAAVRTTYLDIVRRNANDWRGTFLSNATRALQGILAADPTDADNAVVNSDRSYEYYFNSSLTMRYDADATPFTATESTGRSPGGLPAPITMQALRKCRGSMRDQVEPDNAHSSTGIRAELSSVGDYARMCGMRVYAEVASHGFWVAVGL
jgi:hypothetical protein